jgi:hypothetical protein
MIAGTLNRHRIVTSYQLDDTHYVQQLLQSSTELVPLEIERQHGKPG